MFQKHPVQALDIVTAAICSKCIFFKISESSCTLSLFYLTFKGTKPLTLALFLTPRPYIHSTQYLSTHKTTQRPTHTDVFLKILVLPSDLYSRFVTVQLSLEPFWWTTRYELLEPIVLVIAKLTINLKWTFWGFSKYVVLFVLRAQWA